MKILWAMQYGIPALFSLVFGGIFFWLARSAAPALNEKIAKGKMTPKEGRSLKNLLGMLYAFAGLFLLGGVVVFVIIAFHLLH